MPHHAHKLVVVCRAEPPVAVIGFVQHESRGDAANSTRFVDNVNRPTRGIGHGLGDRSDNGIGPAAGPVHNHGRNGTFGPGGRIRARWRNDERAHHYRTRCSHHLKKFSTIQW